MTHSPQTVKRNRYLQRAIFGLSKTIHKHLENNWSHRYINEFHSFVCKIFFRINGVTGLTPNKVSAKHVRKLVPQIGQKSSKPVGKPNLKAVEKVRIAMGDLPFKKGYKQRSTDEVLQITRSASFNQPTYMLVDY